MKGLHASSHRHPARRPHAFLPGTSHDDPSKKVCTDVKLQEAGRLKLRPSLGLVSCTSDVRSWWVKTSLRRAQVENVCKQHGALLLFFSSSCTLGDYVGRTLLPCLEREDVYCLLSLSFTLKLFELDCSRANFSQHLTTAQQQCCESNFLQWKAVHLSAACWLWLHSVQCSRQLR